MPLRSPATAPCGAGTALSGLVLLCPPHLGGPGYPATHSLLAGNGPLPDLEIPIRWGEALPVGHRRGERDVPALWRHQRPERVLPGQGVRRGNAKVILLRAGGVKSAACFLITSPLLRFYAIACCSRFLYHGARKAVDFFHKKCIHKIEYGKVIFVPAVCGKDRRE